MTKLSLPTPREPYVDASRKIAEVWFRFLNLLVTATNAKVNTIDLQVATSTTPQTYTPTAGTTHVLVIATGGGGGGGGATTDGSGAGSGAGGGGGATSIAVWNATELGATAAIQVGAGGTGGANTGANGVAGSSTTVNPAGTATTLTAGGGGLGTGVSATVDAQDPLLGGAGGTASGGDINVSGSRGGTPLAFADGTNPVTISGRGGGSFWGQGAPEKAVVATASAASVAGRDGTAYGTGGSGASSADNAAGAAGGNGMDGVVFILEFIAV